MSEFVDELMTALPEGKAQMVAVAILARYGGETVYIPKQGHKARRIQAAVNMLENGMLPRDVVKTLRTRFQVTAKTAQRDVKEAKQMS